MRECTFTPEINEETYRITSNQEQRDTFDHLYNQAKVITKQKEEMYKEREEKKIAEQIEGCTFQPDLRYSYAVETDIKIPENDDKIEERALKYAEEKKARIGK